MNTRFISHFLFGLLLVGPSWAGTVQISDSVLPAGGGVATAGDYQFEDTLGQPIIGASHAADTYLEAGFWFAEGGGPPVEEGPRPRVLWLDVLGGGILDITFREEGDPAQYYWLEYRDSPTGPWEVDPTGVVNPGPWPGCWTIICLAPLEPCVMYRIGAMP